MKTLTILLITASVPALANTINLDSGSYLELQSFGVSTSVVKCKKEKPNCIVGRIGDGFSLSIGERHWGNFKTYEAVAKEAKTLRDDKFCK